MGKENKVKADAMALLLGYLRTQKELINKLLEGIKTGDTSNETTTIHLAYLLHNLYCALEDLFLEIMRTFENRIEDPAKYHREILKRMIIEIPKIRPRILSKESYQMLDELRGFRHIFRHSYTYSLSSDKVRNLKQSLLAAWDGIEKDIFDLERFLQKHL
jgi:uncharacterized protein YutE (UPF0331/DUF86 family)